MMDPANHRQMLSNLRFALNVMEERSHIGLNDDRATSIRCMLLRRISEAEKALGYTPSTQTCEQTPHDLVMA